MSASRRDFDVVVVGGGIVGAAAAALLANARELDSLSIALIETHPPSAAPSGDIDLRVSALSRASERILRAAGVWQELSSQPLSAYDEMVVWDAGTRLASGATLRFSASSTSEPNLGYIVENRRVLWALYGAPAMRERISLQRAGLTALELEDGIARLTLSDGRRLSTGLVIGADGAASPSRTLAQLPVYERSYAQSAFVTHIRTEQSHRATAYQRFLPRGPIALLPLVDGRSSIVWTTTPEHASNLLSMPETECAAAIEQACDAALGHVEVAGPRAQFPLRLIHAREYCRPAFVLVGDAAHAVHPLAGQGVNLGLLDAAALTEVLVDTVRSRGANAIGELSALRRYERWRKSENTIALGLIDGLNRLFSNDNAGLQLARRTGFALLNRSGVAKRFLIGRALGLSGDVPQLVARSS